MKYKVIKKYNVYIFFMFPVSCRIIFRTIYILMYLYLSITFVSVSVIVTAEFKSPKIGIVGAGKVGVSKGEITLLVLGLVELLLDISSLN